VDQPQTESLTFVLLKRILDMVKESGANRIEAECALNGAVAMLRELQLPTQVLGSRT
jgi:hypothetical protein